MFGFWPEATGVILTTRETYELALKIEGSQRIYNHEIRFAER